MIIPNPSFLRKQESLIFNLCLCYPQLMQINGHEIAQTIYLQLKHRVGDLQKKHITPHLAVILVGDNPASIAYVKQKQKSGQEIGAKVTIINLPTPTAFSELKKIITQLNQDPQTHAILIQRPLPEHLSIQKLELLVSPQKDIDGFHPHSPYTLPLPLAVIKILETIYQLPQARGVAAEKDILSNKKITQAERVARPEGVPSSARRELATEDIGRDEGATGPTNAIFKNWLRSQKTIILGKGPTGGAPILSYLQELGFTPIQIDSQTPNPTKLLKTADIIISAVGKPNIITPNKIKKKAILISVGIFRDTNNKLKGDYEEDKIKSKASYYTPTPGGVGPVNVAMLMQNLTTTAEKQANS